MRKYLPIVVALVIAALATLSSAQSTPTLDLTYTVVAPDLQDMELFLAHDQGIFAKDGVKVNINFVSGDNRGLQALISGKTDIAYITNTLAYKAMETGAKIKIIANTDPVSDYVIVAKPSLKSLADLQGHVVGISTVGGIAQLLPQAAMNLHGYDPSKVTWVSVGGSSARAQALVSGKIDAALVHALQAKELIKKNPQIHIISNLAEQLPNYQFVCYVARDSTIKQKPQALQAFVKGLIQGKRLMMSNKQLTLQDYYKYYPNADKAIVSDIYDFLKPGQMPGENGGMLKKNFQFTVKTLMEGGILKKPLSFDQAYDTSFTNNAIQQLGTVNAGSN